MNELLIYITQEYQNGSVRIVLLMQNRLLRWKYNSSEVQHNIRRTFGVLSRGVILLSSLKKIGAYA